MRLRAALYNHAHPGTALFNVHGQTKRAVQHVPDVFETVVHLLRHVAQAAVTTLRLEAAEQRTSGSIADADWDVVVQLNVPDDWVAS